MSQHVLTKHSSQENSQTATCCQVWQAAVGVPITSHADTGQTTHSTEKRKSEVS